MSLHGTIEVNNERIGFWIARRRTGLTAFDAEHEYECDVMWVDSGRYTFGLTHRYSEGATALAAAVLTEAAKVAPSPPALEGSSTEGGRK